MSLYISVHLLWWAKEYWLEKDPALNSDKTEATRKSVANPSALWDGAARGVAPGPPSRDEGCVVHARLGQGAVLEERPIARPAASRGRLPAPHSQL